MEKKRRRRLCCCTLGVIVLLGLGFFTLFFTYTGRNYITHTLETKLRHMTPFKHASMETLEGFFPFDFVLPNIDLNEAGFHVDAIDTHYNVHYNPYLPWGLSKGDVITQVDITGIDVQGVHLKEVNMTWVYVSKKSTELYIQVPSHHMRSVLRLDSHQQPTELRLQWYDDYIHVTKREKNVTVNVGKGRVYSFQCEDGLCKIPYDLDTPVTMWTPFRSIAKTKKGFEIDVGHTPIYISGSSSETNIGHGPMAIRVALNQAEPLMVKLEHGRLGSYDCIQLEGYMNNPEYVTITSFEAHSPKDNIKGSGQYFFKEQKLKIDMDVHF